MRWYVALVCVLGVAMGWASAARADFYDNFDDGQYVRDPNWDIDAPTWGIDEKIGDYFLEDASSGWLRLEADTAMLPFAFVAAFVDDGDYDPNTSPTYWEDSKSHYILARVKNHDWHTDPNLDNGIVSLMISADLDVWQTLWLSYEFSHTQPWRGSYFALQTVYGTEPMNFKSTRVRGYAPEYCDPNVILADPNYMDEHNGFWLLAQFEVVDANYPAGDPNGKAFRGTCWNGGKYDWNGTWILEVDLSDPTSFSEQQLRDNWPDMYAPRGICGVASYSVPNTGFPADGMFDEIEARTGLFSNVARQLNLTVAHSNWGTIDINPLLPDPTDPNTPDQRILRYTDGTQVVLSATAITKKAFDKWTIYDPNYPNDPNRATVDSNAVLHLTMDKDYQIQASFKCASGLEPLLVIGLFAMAAGVVVRRFR
jgi:hypothetical protein